MGHKDIISKHALKSIARDFATYLFGLAVAHLELLETQGQRVEERRSDLVARVRLESGETFILHIEIQNGNDPLMPYRMMRYLSDILLENPGQPVRQYLVYIGRDRLTMPDGFEAPDFGYRYRVIDLRDLDSEDFLRLEVPDAWILAILCDFGDRTPRQIAHDILSRLAERLGDNLARLREYVDMLDILASNRDLNLDIYEELKMLNIDVEKLATYRLGMEKGEALGQQRGEHSRSVMIAKTLLDQNMEPGWIASVTGLDLAEIKALGKNQPKRGG
jgi:hypothetical protein